VARSCLLATVAPFPHDSNCAAFPSLLNSVWCLPPFANIYYYLSPVPRNRDPCSERSPPHIHPSPRIIWTDLHIFSFIFYFLFFFFFFPSLRSPAKSFPWWWRVVFASSVDTVSLLSLSFSCQKHYCYVALWTLTHEINKVFCSASFICSIYHFHSFCTIHFPPLFSIRGFIVISSELKLNKIMLFFFYIFWQINKSYIIFYQGSQCHYLMSWKYQGNFKTDLQTWKSNWSE